MVFVVAIGYLAKIDERFTRLRHKEAQSIGPTISDDGNRIGRGIEARVASSTSLATITSSFWVSSFSRACSIIFSVSAAKSDD